MLASSWGEDAPLPSGYANPSPVFISTFVVSLSLLNSELQQHRGTRPLVMATLAEMPEAKILVLAPARVITREPTHPCVHAKITP